MNIFLTIEESKEQSIDGFPTYVVLKTNIPSTIFYTLDGSDPTEESSIFIERIRMPTDGVGMILKAFAEHASVRTAVIEQPYFTNHSMLGRSRNTGEKGIRTLPFGEPTVDSLAFGPNGELARETSIPFIDLEVKASTRTKIGEGIPDGSTIDFINFAKRQPSFEPATISSPNNNINFDPKALYIIIDGFTDEDRNNQSVKIINRPHNTMELNPSPGQNKMEDYQLSTSGFVRYMINPITGKITFYYRDSRDNRWLKSTQKIEGKSLNLSNIESRPSSFVFRWIEERAQSKIY